MLVGTQTTQREILNGVQQLFIEKQKNFNYESELKLKAK